MYHGTIIVIWLWITFHVSVHLFNFFVYISNRLEQKSFNFFFLSFQQTGAKIIIRGKGSVKDGKIGRKDGQPLPGEDEPLHAYVTANNPENVKKAVEKVRKISCVDIYRHS